MQVQVDDDSRCQKMKLVRATLALSKRAFQRWREMNSERGFHYTVQVAPHQHTSFHHEQTNTMKNRHQSHTTMVMTVKSCTQRVI